MRPILPSQQRPVPGALPCTDGALEALAIIRWAVSQRRNMIDHGWSRLQPFVAEQALAPLQNWLNSHPTHASASSVRELLLKHGDRLRLIMPSTPAGRKKLDRLDLIVL